MIGYIFRKLGYFKGKQRLARLLLGKKNDTIQNIVVNGKYCKFLLPGIRESIGFNIYINGEYEPDDIKLIAAHLSPEGVLVDVGANIGTISFPLCKMKPGIHALCIEGSPRVFSYLSKNKELNALTNCTLLNRAVSNEDNSQVQFYRANDMFGKGSLSNVYGSGYDLVQTISIDSLLKQQQIVSVDVLKVDIEGYEYHAFKGAELTLSAEKAPVVLFEFLSWAEEKAGLRPGASQRLLINYGYKLFKILPSSKVELKEPVTEGWCMILAIKE